MSSKSTVWVSSLLLFALLARPAVAEPLSTEPMRLDDATPRVVAVQFEDSPNDRPDLLDRVYSRPYTAWLEPDGPDRVTIRIRSQILEQSLFLQNDPVPGSFSDFVWVFDRKTGEVLSASFSGVFAYTIDWGFVSSEVHAQVEARMATDRAGGFQPGTPIPGLQLNRFCEDVERAKCREVAAQRYDAERGYVNAVGYLSIDSPLTEFSTYSAVGEARFSELPAATLRVAEGAGEAQETAEFDGLLVGAPLDVNPPEVSSGPASF